MMHSFTTSRTHKEYWQVCIDDAHDVCLLSQPQQIALSTRPSQSLAVKGLSEVGFEPTPTFVDQNAQYRLYSGKLTLESGALDHSAILTVTGCAARMISHL